MQCIRCKDINWRNKGKNHAGEWIHECLSCGQRHIGKENIIITKIEKEPPLGRFDNSIKEHIIPLKIHGIPAPHRSHNEIFTNYFLVVLILYFTPVINWPLDGLAVFFHELSHGLVGLFFGRKIEFVDVFLNHGRIYTHLDNNKLVSFLIGWSGYTGASLWGLLLYRCGLRASPVWFFMFILIIILLIGGTTVWLVIDPNSQAVMLFLYLTLCLSMLLLCSRKHQQFMKHLLLTGGLYIIVDSLIAPFWLLHPNIIHGDDTNLEHFTGIPKIVWIIQWILIGMIAIGFAWSMSNKCTKQLKIGTKQSAKKTSYAIAKA
ncbi:MAG: M50 family metallopeptidase [Magnetococcales bacterium]|nr:M50 family metallopeptidase [Magnetococcales bacterium]